MPVAARKGTKVEVNDIFYNTPVRRKFLKSAGTEFSYAKKIVQSKAFSDLGISFKLYNNDKLIFATDGKNRFEEMFFSFNNEEKKFNIHSYDKIFNEGLKIKIFHSSSDVFFPTRKHQMLFVNSRPVTVAFFYSALDAGYRNYISPGRFPLIYIYLDINSNEIDVNVHPAKKEIKFLNQELIFICLKKTVDEAMNKIFKREIFKGIENDNILKFSHNEPKFYSEASGRNEYFQEVIFKDKKFFDDNGSISELDFNILGVVFDTYIVVEKSDKIFLIDQHAACEAIIYNKKKEKYKKNSSKESLVIPIIFEIDRWNDQIEEKIKILNKENFLIEKEEGLSLKIIEVPSILLVNKDYDFIVEILKKFFEEKLILKDKSIIDFLLVEASCKEAVKRGDKLTLLELGEVSKEYFGYNITNCPHGRPSHFEITRDYLEKIFQRKK